MTTPALDRPLPLHDFYHAAKQMQAHQSLIFDGEKLTAADAEELGCSCTCYSSSIPETQREVNRKTWQAFEASVRQSYSASRIVRLSERYQFNFRQAIESGRPLQLNDIEAVGVGGDRLFAQDLQELAGATPLASLSREQIAGPNRNRQRRYVISEKIVRSRVGPHSCYDLVTHNPLSLDRKKLEYTQNVEDFPQRADIPDFVFVQRMGKIIVNLELEVGEIIITANNGGVDYFTVYQKIGTGDGLVAYALKPLAAILHSALVSISAQLKSRLLPKMS